MSFVKSIILRSGFVKMVASQAVELSSAHTHTAVVRNVVGPPMDPPMEPWQPMVLQTDKEWDQSSSMLHGPKNIRNEKKQVV